MAGKPNFPADAPTPGHETDFHAQLDALNQRLYEEGVLAVELVEAAMDALRRCDKDAARSVRTRDTEVDVEEVKIEEETVRMIALHQPVASDLRRLMLIIKANADIERIADHATGVCKTVLYLGDAPAPIWPPSLLEMGDLLVPRAHEALKALRRTDAAAAERIITDDETLDLLGRKAFEEIEEANAAGRLSARASMLAYRASRELERISDLLGNICEDVIYAKSGRIVRHAKRRMLQ
ncbi:MAG: phosphate transport system regulatory protein PhoU [Phycisphaerales bacterium]|nr:MAG: phosphate transport system regulatory protein PhoU [Phycisphaerales bacterium]